MDSHQVELAAIGIFFPVILGAAAFLLKWMLRNTEETIKAIGADVRSMVERVATHAQSLADLRSRVERLEAFSERRRRR